MYRPPLHFLPRKCTAGWPLGGCRRRRPARTVQGRLPGRVDFGDEHQAGPGEDREEVRQQGRVRLKRWGWKATRSNSRACFIVSSCACRITVRACRTARGPFLAIISAMAMASSRAIPGALMRLTSPILRASSAPTFRPVRIISAAGDAPINRVRPGPPPQSGMRPSFTSAKQITA